MNRLLVGALSLAATALFFFEYLPPAKRVQFFSDIEGYHYPLYTYAHRAIKEGRLPEWDASLYCGIVYIANPQTAFFYPPNWVLHWVNRKHAGVRFWTVEALLIAHFWIAFFTAWLWLRHRARSDLGAALGAALFAFSGYMTGEAQHLGAMCAYAWIPLGLHAVDRRSLPQLALASALCWLAGYPPEWVAFCACVALYALTTEGWRRLGWSLAGLLLSIGVFAVQLAPALEATSGKLKDTAFGGGWPGGWFFLVNFLLPNYYEQSNRAGKLGPETEQYLYLGAAALLVLLFARQHLRPALALIAVSLFIAKDPLGVLQGLVYRFPTLGDAIREWNFLAVLFAGLALLTASGTAALAARPASRWPRWVAPLSAVAAVAWSARQLWVWHHGAHFGFAWASAVEVAITAILAYLLLRQVRSRAAVAALLLLVWTDYKVYGTSRRFNAMPGAMDVQFRDDVRTGGPQWAGVAPSVYQILQQNRHYRVLFADAEWANEIRHYGMASPQGADPFVPVRYRAAVEQFIPFSTNRLFPFQFQNPEMMDAFGVKYVISSKPIQHAALQPIAASGDWYFKVYEFVQARPIYRFEAGTAQHTTWTPEHRAFTVDSPTGGEFVLLENFAPGWEALVDGTPVPVDRTRITFQRIQVPPGRHEVVFRYRSRALRAGAAISALSLIAVALLALRRRPRPASAHATAVTILM